MKYFVIAGNPYVGYTGTLTFTSLNVKLVTDNKEKAQKFVKENFETYGGLMLIIDSEGNEVE